MTFENAAWAINGALLGASLARRAQYASTGGNSGTVQKDDLKVTQLSVPGVGVQIAPGVGLVLNKYQSTVNETYVASNPSTHIIPSEDMPASSGSTRSFIVAVVVGDPDFSQVGHPFMGSDDPPAGEEQTFEYVRPVLVQVSAGATSLTGAYPNLPLARIDIPASTTTITDAMITDLRTLAQPRQAQELFASPWNAYSNVNVHYIPAGSSYGGWGTSEYTPMVKVPSWATRAIVVASVNGAGLADSSSNARGGIRVELGTVIGPATTFDIPSSVGGYSRMNLQAAANFNVSSIAGTTVDLRVMGYQDLPASPTLAQRLRLQSGSQVIYDVRFFEE